MFLYFSFHFLSLSVFLPFSHLCLISSFPFLVRWFVCFYSPDQFPMTSCSSSSVQLSHCQILVASLLSVRLLIVWLQLSSLELAFCSIYFVGNRTCFSYFSLFVTVLIIICLLLYQLCVLRSSNPVSKNLPNWKKKTLWVLWTTLLEWLAVSKGPTLIKIDWSCM